MSLASRLEQGVVLGAAVVTAACSAVTESTPSPDAELATMAAVSTEAAAKSTPPQPPDQKTGPQATMEAVYKELKATQDAAACPNQTDVHAVVAQEGQSGHLNNLIITVNEDGTVTIVPEGNPEADRTFDPDDELRPVDGYPMICARENNGGVVFLVQDPVRRTLKLPTVTPTR